MIRYTHYKLLVLAVPLLMVAGCSKKFLEIDPQGQLTEVQALRDPEAANQLVGGVYNTLYLGGFDNSTVGFQWAILGDVASDDSDKGSTPSDYDAGGAGDVDNFRPNPANGIYNNIWNGHYLGIARANKAIDILNSSTIETTAKNRLLGEARFLRGFYYFNLVRAFGGVPKVVRVPEPAEVNSDEFQTRASVADIYAVILEDLQFAVDNLSVKGTAGTQLGRATKGAAQSYLAKVYMYQKNWQKTLELTQGVINSNQYTLVPNYNLVFREKAVSGVGGANNSESIFEVQTGLNVAENAVSPLYSNGQGPRGRGGWNDLGFGFNSPSADLAGFYEPGDTRRNATIIFINPTVAGRDNGTYLWDGFRLPSQDSVENPRYNYKAYHSPLLESGQLTSNKDTKPKNIRLMRYAEVLLMYAEAQAMLGNAAEATAKLNMVRSRANLPASTGTQANIWRERRAELAMEHDRFFDLVRQGRAGTVLRAHGKPFVDGRNEVFPIPNAQRDLSGGRLTQNNGY
ncbi:RagB/SusD family nutrient uptake outer membrane protein [Segetibacter sp. 3557_3]|uniref:RagB/SusD family nutrient uptake outer membrane protein n=1 Tax=Segetibacter sp. 3557_3 TaxID=2547429 RepID=UPI00105878C7|nr:RagB/SusD family nutrient uptake outer membrane protein [Segetibacter sp. 3557_3]TDH23067.1 RagB/SusD family nutrient uptake outer membrane protein [Segetibacter sp. 3557_3]